MLTDYRRSSLAILRTTHRVLVSIAIGTGLLILTHLFVLTVIRYTGSGMEPAIKSGQFVLIDQISPRLKTFRIGSLIAIRTQAGNILIKRISGRPGEVVTEEGKSITLGARQYFVISDDANQGIGSHQIGPISEDQIIGSAIVLF